jgi:hypothetical protein
MKGRQFNSQKKRNKMTKNGRQNTTKKTKDLAKRTLEKWRCSQVLQNGKEFLKHRRNNQIWLRWSLYGSFIEI